VLSALCDTALSGRCVIGLGVLAGLCVPVAVSLAADGLRITRDRQGVVFIEAPDGSDVRYTLDGSAPTAGSPLYSVPLFLPGGGPVRAIAMPRRDDAAPSVEAAAEFGLAPGKWRVVGADGDAVLAIDNDPATVWRPAPPYPHEITIDLGASFALTGLTYLAGAPGAVGQYEVLASDDGTEWAEPVATGSFADAKAAEQRAHFGRTVAARYVRFRALGPADGSARASIGEIGLTVAEPLKVGTGPADPAAWQQIPIDMPAQAVRRTNEEFPLSDLSNTEGWVRYEPLWDEFGGTTLDAAKWYPYNPGWKGRQPGWFSPDNVTVSDGKLHLALRAEDPPESAKAEGYNTFTSAAVQGRTITRYGYFEVKARAMRSNGSSAFWFYDSRPDWWTEIDVFEIGGGAPEHKRRLYTTCHFFNSPGIREHWSVGSYWEAPFDLAGDYHVYGLEWDENDLRFYFDGVLVRRGPNTHWHQPLALNFDSETMPEWFGLPRPEDLPSTYSIEYVRAWKKPGQ